MSHPTPPLGAVGWLDMTVDDADARRDFYAAVVGWAPQGVAMDGGAYEDYAMATAGGVPAAGVCWKRGANADQPAGWVPYFVVADISAALRAATARGAELVRDGRGASGAGFVVLRDPGGVPFALWQGDPIAADPTPDA